VARATLERLTTGLTECDRLLDQLVIETPALVTGLLNLFACRVYLDPSRLHRLAGEPPSQGREELASACVDFRFHFHSGSHWLYAYLPVRRARGGGRWISRTSATASSRG
jgi:hypothetical protein